MHRILARAAVRAVLLCAAVAGLVLLGAHGGTSHDTGAHSAPHIAPGGAISGASTGASSSAPSGAGSGDSDYVLRTEGPYIDPATRIVTGTLLLTGLVLTALGAVGGRERAVPAGAEPSDVVVWQADTSGQAPAAMPHTGPDRDEGDGRSDDRGDADHPPAAPRG